MERVAAFVIVGTSLVILADFETTGPIAVSFGYLILLSSLILVGPVAFSRLQTMIGVSATEVPLAGSPVATAGRG